MSCSICGGALDSGFVELTAELIRPGRTYRFRDAERRVGEGVAQARVRFALPDLGGGQPKVVRVRVLVCVAQCMAEEGGLDPVAVISAARRLASDTSPTWVAA